MDSRTFTVLKNENEVGKYMNPGKRMSVKEFQDWLDGIDTGNDGIISKGEIEEAFKSLGIKFANWKTKHAMASADLNNNRVIDSDLEMKEIIEYDQKNRGLTIYQDE